MFVLQETKIPKCYFAVVAQTARATNHTTYIYTILTIRALEKKSVFFEISLKFIPKGAIDKTPSFFKVMFLCAEFSVLPAQMMAHLKPNWMNKKIGNLKKRWDTILCPLHMLDIFVFFSCCGRTHHDIQSRDHVALRTVWLVHYIRVTLASNSPATREFVQRDFVQDNSKKKSSKCHMTGPLWGEFIGYDRVPLTKG